MSVELEALIHAKMDRKPLFGLVEWAGERIFGDWEYQNSALWCTALVHGDNPAEGTGPGVAVYTTTSTPTDQVVRLKNQVLGPPRDSEQLHQTIVALIKEPTEPVAIPVNDAIVEFQMSRWNARWWAAATIEDLGVVVEACGIEPNEIALTKISSLEPYLDGRRQLLKRLRGDLR